MKTRIQRNSSGDTIVEVLICIALTGAILSGAFVVTHSSTLGVLDTQEHTHALQLASGQLEGLRTIISSDPSALTGAPTNFCISGSSTIIDSGLPGCNVDDTGAPTTAQPIYNLSMNLDSTTSVYKIAVTWPSVLRGNDSVQLVYRMEQPVSDPGDGSGTPPGGTAGIGPGPCDPGDPSCSDTPPPDGSYDWSDEFQNISPAGQVVTGCSWNWGDGETTANEACSPGDTIDHTFVAKPLPDPYPQDCQKYSYVVTLTENLANGLNPTTTYDDDLPTCD